MSLLLRNTYKHINTLQRTLPHLQVRYVKTKASDIRANNLIDDSNKLLHVKSVTKREMGRGHTTYNVEVVERVGTAATGKKSYIKYNAGDEVEVVSVATQQLTYLYSDAQILYFMNNDTYEQLEIAADVLDPALRYYLIDGQQYTVSSYKDAVVGIDIPEHVRMRVVETSRAVQGSTDGAVKEAVLQNDLRIDVPMFIETGDEIIVKSSTGTYLQRVKDTT